MTAKNLKEKLIEQAFASESGINYPEGSIGWVIKQGKIDLLNAFCEQLCKEQRELCDESVRFEDGILLDDSILNAPTPEL